MTNERDDDAIQERLRSLRVEPADDGFSASLHRRLAAAGAPRDPGLWARFVIAVKVRPLLAGSAAGLVVGVAAFALLWSVTGRGVERGAIAAVEPPSPAPVVYQVPAEKVAVIRLHFTAEVAVEEVDFSVELPDGLAFWSEGERLPDRSFEWRDRLQAGDNPIPIAVRADHAGTYRVKARARVGSEQLEHEVVLEVVEGV